MIRYFKYSYSEPLLAFGEFKCLKDSYKQFFKKTYLTHYPCNLCGEECSPEIETNENKLFYLCKTGFIPLPQVVQETEITKYQFSIKSFLDYVANKNNIVFNYTTKAKNTIYIGNKVINNQKHNFYYLLDITKNNQLTDIATQRLKSLKSFNEKLIVITPDKILKDDKAELLLKELDCYLLGLNELIEADFLVNIQDLQEYDLVVNTETLSIIIYGIEYTLNKSPDTFSFIYNLAQRPKEILNIEEARGINKAYKEDKTLSESTRKMKGRFISGLKKVFLEQNKPIKTLDDLIKSLNKNENYYLNIDKEKVKIIGNLPN